MEEKRRKRFWLVGFLIFWSCFAARQDAPSQAIERIVEVSADNFEYIGKNYKMALVDSQRCFVFSGSNRDTLWAVAFLHEDILLREVNLISATPTETEKQVYQVELYDLLVNAVTDTADYTFRNRNEPEAVLFFKMGEARLNRRQKETQNMSLEAVNEFLSGNAVGILVTRLPQLLEDQGGKSCFFGVHLHAATMEK